MSSQVTSRLSRLSFKPASVASMPFSLNAGEIAAAIFALLFLVTGVIYYVTSLRPEQQRLETLERQYEEQRKDILKMTPQQQTLTKTRAEREQEILDSLNAFKGSRLKPLNPGRIALLNEINALARKNGVQLASGIEMKTEGGEPQAGKKKTKEKRKDDVYRFPMLGIRFTVVGPYDKLRAFINELQHNKQFLIIDAVNLQAERAAEGGGGRARRGQQAAGAISLSIEASAYFQPMEHQG
ncbi:MAG TPA: GspMb/PilO family protein [Blastocatellia bacterium]|nr:GspMb/PilO family protein [Blastocatellia bacterium]